MKAIKIRPSTSTLLLFFSLAFLSPSCKKINKLVQFNMNYKTEVVIPSTTGISLPFNILTPDVETNSESSFRANDTRKDLINEIALTELVLQIKSPDGGTFSFLKSAELFIQAEGLDEEKVAFITSVPDNVGNQLTLNTTGQDLAPFIKKDEFKLKLRSVIDEAIAKDHVVEIRSRFHVEGKVIGSD